VEWFSPEFLIFYFMLFFSLYFVPLHPQWLSKFLCSFCWKTQHALESVWSRKKMKNNFPSIKIYSYIVFRRSCKKNYWWLPSFIFVFYLWKIEKGRKNSNVFFNIFIIYFYLIDYCYSEQIPIISVIIYLLYQLFVRRLVKRLMTNENNVILKIFVVVLHLFALVIL